jgi:hypothetical protein
MIGAMGLSLFPRPPELLLYFRRLSTKEVF